MNVWVILNVWIILIIIALVAVVKIIYQVYQKKHTNTRTNTRTNTQIGVSSQTGSTSDANLNETGPMIYYANDRHGGRDREYRFNYKKVNGSWRAYILRMPNLGNRDSGSIATHRHWDNGNPYICWDKTVSTLKDMQSISKVWADSIQEYIATGKPFG